MSNNTEISNKLYQITADGRLFCENCGGGHLRGCQHCGDAGFHKILHTTEELNTARREGAEAVERLEYVIAEMKKVHKGVLSVERMAMAELGFDAGFCRAMMPSISPDKQTFLSSLPERCKEEWVKVSERLPEEQDGGFKDYVIAILGKNAQNGHPFPFAIIKRKSVKRSRHTHWMPLPNPPQQ